MVNVNENLWKELGDKNINTTKGYDMLKIILN